MWRLKLFWALHKPILLQINWFILQTIRWIKKTVMFIYWRLLFSMLGKDQGISMNLIWSSNCYRVIKFFPTLSILKDWILQFWVIRVFILLDCKNRCWTFTDLLLNSYETSCIIYFFRLSLYNPSFFYDLLLIIILFCTIFYLSSPYKSV